MCKIGGGANRCDAHWGPAQKAADLAKRRAKYAASKGGNVRSYNKQDASEVLEQAKNVTGQNATDFKVTAVNYDNPVLAQSGSYDEHLLKESGEASYNPELNIHSQPLEGELVKQNYYASSQIEGAVNWENLDEKSYLEFGFENPSGEAKGPEDISFEEMYEKSDLELKNMNLQNLYALNIFTSDAYEWINQSLYNKDENAQLHSSGVEDGEDVLTGEESDYISYEGNTLGKFNTIVNQIDDAFSKVSGQQRIVYRGMSEIALKGGEFSNEKMEFQLGQEMVFDGYQSASYAPEMAAGFANVTSHSFGGVLLEIKTSSGIHLTANSHHEEEKEVLLPRNARYMVVGVHHHADYETQDSTMDTTESFPDITVIQLVEITEKGEVASMKNRPASPPPLTALQTKVEKD